MAKGKKKGRKKVGKKGKEKERSDKDRTKKTAVARAGIASAEAGAARALSRMRPKGIPEGSKALLSATCQTNGSQPPVAARPGTSPANSTTGAAASSSSLSSSLPVAAPRHVPPAILNARPPSSRPQAVIPAAPANEGSIDRDVLQRVQIKDIKRTQGTRYPGGGGQQSEDVKALRPTSAVPSRPGTSQAVALAMAPPSRGLDTVEHIFLRAAQLLLDADYVLIAAGAGFSADSGLPVYKDIANVEAYRRMKVTYADLCTPDWLQRDPEVFFGFWGSCYNDYMETEPHEGYQICKQWNDTRFHGTTSATARQDGAACVAGRLQKLSLGDSTGARPVSREAAAGGVPSRTGGVGAGSVARAHLGRKMSAARVPEKACEMFVYTSNVDTAFERTGFGTEQVLEIHGNVCEWQCAKPERCRDVTWRIPDRHRFALDKRMMRAPRWTTAAPAPRIAHAHSGCTAQAPGLECCSVPSRLPMLRETTKVSEQLLQEHDSDRAASARTTHRSHAHAGGGVSNGSLSGSGIHAVRGLASNRPPSACSSCSSSSNLSGHDCLSPGSVHHGGAAAGAAPTQAATPAFSLSAYPPRAGAGPAQQPPPQRAGDVQTEQKVLNHIRCPGCGRAARPNVLMFDDDDWVPVETKMYKRFAKKAVSEMKEGAGKMVIIEGGCGKRVPTVRLNSEKLVKLGASLIRINLDYPGNSKAPNKTVSLEMQVLAALRGIDAAIRRLRGLDSADADP